MALPCLLVRESSGEFAPPEGAYEVINTESWCGAKCLWSILRAYGAAVSLEDVRNVLHANTSDEGTFTLAEIESAATQLGYHATCVSGSLAQLSERPEAKIVVINTQLENQSNSTNVHHAQILLNVNGHIVTVLEPLLPGKPIRLPVSHFERIWLGKAILVSPRPIQLNAEVSTALVASFWGIAIAFACVFASAFCRFSRLRPAAKAPLILLALLAASSGACSPANNSNNLVSFDATVKNAVAPTGRDVTVAETFKFKNVSRSPLSITHVDVGCKCTVPKYSTSSIPPQSSGFVKLESDLRAVPKTDRYTDATAVVHFSGDVNAAVAIKLIIDTSTRADVPAVTPERLSFGKCLLNSATTSRIQVTTAKGWKVSANSPDPSITISVPEIVSSGAGFERHSFRLTFVPRVLAVPPDWCIRFEVERTEDIEQLLVPVAADIRHDLLEASPPRVSFGSVGAHAVSQAILITSAQGEDDSLHERIRVEHDPDVFVVQEQTAKDETKLVVTPRFPEADAGAFWDGEIRIYCEGADGPPLLVPYFGYKSQSAD